MAHKSGSVRGSPRPTGGAYSTLYFRLLYCSGLWPGHTLELRHQDFHPEEMCIHLRNRVVFLDPETTELLQRYTAGHTPEQPLFDLKEADLQAELSKYASQTGLHQRMLAIQRPFTLETLRFAFAVHCCAQRIDPISLMTLMGLYYYGTFTVYNMCALHRHLPAYDAATPEWAKQT